MVHERTTAERLRIISPDFASPNPKIAATRSNATTRRIIKTEKKKKKKKKNGRDCSQSICLINVSRNDFEVVDFRADESIVSESNCRHFLPSLFSRLLTECLSNRLPVKRVDCKANESIDSSRFESNRSTFSTLPQGRLTVF